MPSIQLIELTFSHTSSRPLFDGVSAVFPTGWTGLVGANGSGKTTLLQLIAGRLAPDAGSVTTDSTTASILCEQSVEFLTDPIRQLGDSYDGSASELRGKLHLDVAQLDRWPSLSPGERKRWQIGAALVLEPQILLLDEPTNHLDGEARQLLSGVLTGHRGLGILVSHDRTFLNSLTSATARLTNEGVTVWGGSYGRCPERLACLRGRGTGSLRTCQGRGEEVGPPPRRQTPQV